MTGEQLQNYNFVLPDIHVSQFLRIPAHMARIYFIDDWDVECSPLVGQPSETDIADPDSRNNITDYGPACKKIKSEIVSNEDGSVDPSVCVKIEMDTEGFDPLLNTDSEGLKDDTNNMLDETSYQQLNMSPTEARTSIDPGPGVWNGHRGWKPSFPVEEEAFYKMKAGKMQLMCPNCKKTFAGFPSMYQHFNNNIKCKKDHKALEITQQPDKDS